MGIDIYMQWNGMTESDKENQITGFADTGECGYLRGAYFGGYSDVLRFLFDWMDWDIEPYPIFDPVAFEEKLNKLKENNLERPGKSRWDHTKGAKRGWDLSGRQNKPIHPDTIKEYEAFLAFGKRLLAEGKQPRIYISY